MSFSASFGEKMDYGGFEERSPERTHQKHKQIMQEIAKQNTKVKRTAMESKSGSRYSVLSELDYIDLVQFTIIDPMHCLFLGTAKYFFKAILSDILTAEQLKDIQTLVDNTKLPHDIGRIPHKISSQFSSLTANQWQIWVLYLSLGCLYKKVDTKVFAVWRYFVEATHLLCQPVISVNDLRDAHEKIMTFCREFEKLFGSSKVTCNIHLHQHIVSDILAYGNINNYHLYGFERLNGILGNMPINNRSCEIQFMRSFIKMQMVETLYKPQTFSNVFGPLMPKRKEIIANHIKLMSTSTLMELIELSKGPVRICNLWFNLDGVKPIGTYCLSYTDSDILKYVKKSLCTVVGNVDNSSLAGSFKKYFAVEYLGEMYGSFNSRLDRSSQILASWCGIDGDIDSSGQKVRPGEVQYYMMFSIEKDGVRKDVIIAHVLWFQTHYAEHALKSRVCSVWCKEMYEPVRENSFIPIQRIKGRFISTYININNEAVRLVTPKLAHIYI